MEGSMKAPSIIKELVEHFQRNRDACHSPLYNETQLRREFLDPLFEGLGWDVQNKQGYSEAYKDVVHEDAIKAGEGTRAPDYCFRIGGTRKFFVEAKKPAINIREDASPAFQLRRYAWSAKLPLSILTDFEEFAVYDCRIRPHQTDKASAARLIILAYEEYLEKWEEIASIFSHDAVLKGSFDKYAESKRRRGTAEVDDAFLSDIEMWRKEFAQNFALRNERLSQRQLNFAVERTIDRIIFLRVCEDRGIESYGQLLDLIAGRNIYARLFEVFRRADDRYNSGLFHFQKETGRAEDLDELTPTLTLDDKPLKEMIQGLYYPDSPYAFSVLSADILGQVYEQFLGKVIRLTEGHHAKVEDKPEVKKAGGVYYTPTYIVDYIVKHTIGKLLEGKTPKEVVKLRILDPACGSGSFLIGAYQYLLDWHLNWYTQEAGVGARGVAPAGAKAARRVRRSAPKYPIYQTTGGQWRLTPAERKRILLNNIYGVDIDPQAVEVTKLSLLLKALEGETHDTLESELKLGIRALPDLGSNIKCGNSLIGPDFYDHAQMELLDEEEKYRINAFDWNTEFAEIMKAGGFDAVIGNPPYVRQETLGEQFKAYARHHYQVYHGVADLYVYFIERAVSLLREGGLFSYIVSNKWMRANYGKPLQKWLKRQFIEEIVDFGDLPVFKKATSYPCILRLRKDGVAKSFQVATVKTLDFPSLYDYVNRNAYQKSMERLTDEGWSLADDRSEELMTKLRQTGQPLETYVHKEIFRGVLTGLNEAFVIDAETRKKLVKEDKRSAELIKPFLIGRDVKRFGTPPDKNYLIMIPKGWTRSTSQKSRNAWAWFQRNYPAIARHLAPHAEAAEKRFDKGEYWWELRACDYYAEFEKPKIIYPNICKRPEFTYDDSGFCTNQKCFIIPLADKYLLGILNSSITFFLFRSILPKLRGDFYEPSYVYFKEFPIRPINFSDKKDKARHDKMVSLVERMLRLHKEFPKAKTPDEKTRLERQIAATDKQIDNLVYELYELTEEEIKIVEGE